MESSSSKRNKAIVEGLYKALAKGDHEKVSTLLASDLEWWFHGPPNCNHMMRVLTGGSEPGRPDFSFKPRSTVAPLDGGRWVVAEGWKGDRAYWVHVWTLTHDGLITQFREYFNTMVTVRDLRANGGDHEKISSDTKRWATIWQSQLPCKNRGGGGATSMPGLVLAI